MNHEAYVFKPALKTGSFTSWCIFPSWKLDTFLGLAHTLIPVILCVYSWYCHYRNEFFLFSKISRQAVGPTSPLLSGHGRGLFFKVKAARAWSWPLTCIWSWVKTRRCTAVPTKCLNGLQKDNCILLVQHLYWIVMLYSVCK